MAFIRLVFKAKSGRHDNPTPTRNLWISLPECAPPGLVFEVILECRL
jgi:hypothetical protein